MVLYYIQDYIFQNKFRLSRKSVESILKSHSSFDSRNLRRGGCKTTPSLKRSTVLFFKMFLFTRQRHTLIYFGNFVAKFWLVSIGWLET